MNVFKKMLLVVIAASFCGIQIHAAKRASGPSGLLEVSLEKFSQYIAVACEQRDGEFKWLERQNLQASMAQAAREKQEALCRQKLKNACLFVGASVLIASIILAYKFL